MFNKTLSILLVLAVVIVSAPLIAFPASAEIWNNLLQYEQINSGTAIRVYGCSEEASGTLTIPSTLDGLPVTQISDYTFMYCTNLTSITIPKSVVKISSEAFTDSGLKEIIYEGTIEDWERIELGEQSSVSNALKLICTNSEKQLRWW